MELRNLSTFLVAAELLNFSRVAEQLGYSQSAISIQIQQLEKELGVKLFDRIGKNTSLTNEGERLAVYANKILNTLDEAKSDIGRDMDRSGILRLGIIESLLASVFPRILKEFHKTYPFVRISVTTGTTDFLVEQLWHNEIDMLYFADKQLDFPDWIKAFNRKEKVCFIASADNPLTQKSSVPIEEILKQDIILTEGGVGYRYKLEQKLAADGLSISPFLEVGNTEVIKKLVSSNMGISYLPLLTLREDIDRGSIKPINNKKYQLQVFRQLVYLKSKWISKPMKELITIISHLEEQ